MKSPVITDMNAFLAARPVFTGEEFGRYLVRRGGAASAGNRQTLLRYHIGRGRIVRVRRDLYAAVPPGTDPDTFPADTYLIAGRLTEDAVLAYRSALEVHGVAQSVSETRTVVSAHRAARPLRFRGVEYRAVLPPAALGGRAMTWGVEDTDRAGLTVRVTSLERTVADALDRPALCGGWEEVWRSLTGLEAYLDAREVAAYTLALGRAATAARVGHFLEQARERLRIPSAVIDALRAHAPRSPIYAERSRRQGHPVPGWNLLVPSGPQIADGDAEGGIPA